MTCSTLKTTSLVLGVLSCAALFSAPAFADKDKGKGHGRSAEKAQHEEIFDRDSRSWVRLGFDDDRRDAVRRYLENDFRRNCPPGLAKKHNGCLPPGLAKKYRVGDALPPGLDIRAVPRDLLDLLGTAPRGHQYVQVDNDILLIAEASRKVIDAVTLFSAVGN